jgi:hypothetical protein
MPTNTAGAQRILVIGHFSDRSNTLVTAGDLLACRAFCEWLSSADIPFDVAYSQGLGDGVDIESAVPAQYSTVVWVCGPITLEWPFVRQMKETFAECRFVAVDVSTLDPAEQWEWAHAIFERDGGNLSRPDIALAATSTLVPVVGVFLVHPQPEYGERAMHHKVDLLIDQFIQSQPLAALYLDTLLPQNPQKLKSTEEIESVVAKMDMVITTRMHGLIFALRNSIPVIAIDPIHNGAKVKAQAEAVGWPVILTPESITVERLREGMDFCLSNNGREIAQTCRDRGKSILEGTREEILRVLMRD